MPVHRQALNVSRNEMKAVTTTILLFIALHSMGQPKFRFDSSSKAVDSLYARLSTLARSVQNHHSNVSALRKAYKFTITENKEDSLTISFFDNSSKLLYRKVIRLDKQGCRWWEVDEIYDSSERLVYWEALKWSCLKPEEKTDKDVRYFDALLYEKSGFVYDSIGRIKERIWWYTPLNTVRRYKYTHHEQGNQTYTITKHDYDSFWK